MRVYRLAACVVWVAAVMCWFPARSAANNPVDPDFIDVQLIAASDLDNVTAMTFAPDGRLFILEQDGTVRIYADGQLLPDPFMQLTVDDEGERGLLGLAFDPDFANNQYIYVYYTTPEPVNQISRFTADGDQVAPNSELPLMTLEELTAKNHNGGALAFGNDGKLYAAVGDGGNTPDEAQSLDSRSGVILRLNTDGSIPTDNPFYNTVTGENRAIWAYGLRNPFVIDFDEQTGDLFINDVGGGLFEEIDQGQAGANYGWPIFEGNLKRRQNEPTPLDYASPLHDYARGSDGTCAITGGEVYRPAVPQFPAEYEGTYFFTDFCGGKIRRYLGGGTETDFAVNLGFGLVDLETAPNGSLYYLKRAGQLRRISYVNPDVNDDTVVTPADAVYVVNRLNTADLSADVDGSGDVTGTDVDHVIGALGTTRSN